MRMHEGAQTQTPPPLTGPGRELGNIQKWGGKGETTAQTKMECQGCGEQGGFTHYCF